MAPSRCGTPQPFLSPGCVITAHTWEVETMDRREFVSMGAVATLAAVRSPRGLAKKAVSAVAGDPPAGWFDVRGYGAVGDGSTDDTSAISAAIDAARAAGGGVVWFAAGRYVSSTVTLHGGITMQGAGWQSIIKLKDSTDSHLIVTPTGQTNWYGVIRDLCLDGNRSKNTAGDGLHLFAATNYRIEGVKISRFAGHGIAFSGTNDFQTIAPWVVNCGIYECGGNGIDVAGTTADCKFHALDIGLCDKGVILPSAGFLSDVTIWKCNTGLYGYWAANSHLHLVRVERCRYNGFLFEGCKDVVMVECRAYENNQSGGDGSGFAFRGTAEHPCVRLNVSACVSGLTGSAYEKQKYGFTDSGSANVDYVLCQGCTALGNMSGGYSLGAGSHDVLGVNM
ncbi:MAG: hypothetical protein C0418_03580 [Coriobacteriaceae bacterium]|nr:hypothetical protein [Coriobacteriaceae bacterium]